MLVEVRTDGTLIPKAPYSGSLGLVRTLTILGCRNFASDALKEVEFAVTEALTDPVKTRRFFAALTGRLVTVAAVKKALAATTDSV